jgi:MFS family permease
MVGITATVIQGGLIGRLSKRFGEVALVRAGLAIVILSFVMIPFVAEARAYGLMLVNAVIMACGTGIYNPSNMALLSKSADADEQGAVLGLNQSLAALGRVLGPAISGFLFEMSPTIPFWVGACIMSGSLFLAFRLRKPT